MSYYKRKDGFKDWQNKQNNKARNYENYKKKEGNDNQDLLDNLIWWLITAPVNTTIYSYKGIKKLFKKKDNRIVLGKDDQKTEWHLFPVEMLQHLAISGSTGVGKSYFAVGLILQLISSKGRVFFIDPHGNAIMDIYTRLKYLDNVDFYTPINKLNDNEWQVTGINILFKMGSPMVLDSYVSDVMRCLFGGELTDGFIIAPQARFIIESAVYFTNNYRYYLAGKGLDNETIKQLCLDKQLTINDLATLQSNTQLYELMADVLSYGGNGSTHQRQDLATKWLNIINNGKPNGFDLAVNRFVKLTNLQESQLFLESKGFDVVESLKTNKSVMCDLRGIDEITMSVIASLIFDRVYSLHKDKKITGQTQMFIDEAKMVKLPSLDLIIEQARKFNLGVVLMFQFLDQFKDNEGAKNAIKNTIVNSVKFGNKDEKDKDYMTVKNYKIGEFLFKRMNIEVELKSQSDIGKELREYQTPIMAESSTIVRKRMQDKKNNIYKYFTYYEPKNTQNS